MSGTHTKTILKVKKNNEYEVYISYKEFTVIIENIEYKVIKKNIDIQVFKKIKDALNSDVYQELGKKEVDDFLLSLNFKDLERTRQYSHSYEPSIKEEVILNEAEYRLLVEGLKEIEEDKTTDDTPVSGQPIQ